MLGQIITLDFTPSLIRQQYLTRLCWRMKEKVQSILSWEKRVSTCTLSTGLPGRCIVVAIPCGRHAWADHHIRFHSQSHSPTISYKTLLANERKSAKHPELGKASINLHPLNRLARPLYSSGDPLRSPCLGR